MVKRLNTIDYGDTIRPGFNGAADIITTGNITAGLYFGDGGNLSNISGGGSDTLSNVVARGNTTSNTVQFSNTDISFVTSGKVGISNTSPNESLTVTGNLKLTDDGDTIYLGADNDFQIYHDGANTELANGNGNLIIRQDAGDTFMRVNGGNFKVQDLTSPTPNDILVVDTTNQRIGISNSSPSNKLSVSGDIFTDGPIKFSQDIRLETNSSDDNIRIGNFAGDGTLGNRTISIGAFSARSAGNYSIGIGNSAGRADQGDYAIAIGHYSGGGDALQGDYAIAIGDEAGRVSQNNNAVAIGQDAGKEYQGLNSVALGPFAGQNGQNNYAVAIGYGAGLNGQHTRSIVLNASGSVLNTSNTNSTVIKPIQSVSFSNVLTYDSATGELGNSEDLNVSNIILNTGLTSIADMSTSTLSIDMEGYSYRTLAVNTAGQNITDLSITNAITGSQGVVFITATTSSCAISKPFATSTYKSGNSALTLPSSNVAALSFVYNGTNFFCNTAEYI